MCHYGSRLVLPPMAICIIVLPVKIVLMWIQPWNHETVGLLLKMTWKPPLVEKRITEYDLNVLLTAKEGHYRC